MQEFWFSGWCNIQKLAGLISFYVLLHSLCTDSLVLCLPLVNESNTGCHALTSPWRAVHLPLCTLTGWTFGVLGVS